MVEDYLDDEYITNENDPTRVEKITEEDYTIPEKEEKIEFDKIFENVRATSADFTQYDKNQTQVVLDSLRKGNFRND